tara:strand:- start:1068 stop:1781 length:714 start_codon:yes stop_codon:yes gene_type:complete
MNKDKKKILLVEDEAHLARGLKFNLEREGYNVTIVDNGALALETLDNCDFDLMILDLMLPKVGGIEVTRRIRQTNFRFPILMLTAKSTAEDRALGLEVGADDYLTKPFHLPELLLRVRGIMRRWDWYKGTGGGERIFRFSDMWIDFTTGKAKGVKKEFFLTHREAEVIKLLVEKNGGVVSREELLEKVWGYNPDTETRTLDNFVVRLRKYFELNPKRPRHILTIREKGYRFLAEPKD